MSIWGAVAGFIGSQVLGMVWYSTAAFGTPWLKMVYPGKSADELKASAGNAMVVSMVAHAALAGLLNWIYISHMGVDSLPKALCSGLALSGVSALSEICHVMFGNKPWALFFIDHGFNTAVIMIMSAGIGFFA